MMSVGRALAAGSLASIAAAIALAAASKAERHPAAAPINATSHWLHGDADAVRGDIDVAHTGVGVATHHSAAILWGGLFELLRHRSRRDDLAAVARDGIVAAGVAAIVDYVFTPHRLTPGWELVLSKRSMALPYAAMAAAFVSSEYLWPPRRRPQSA